MRGRHGDRNARLAERHLSDPVLGGGRLEAVSRNRLRDDRGNSLFRHLGVGLVLEAVDRPRRPLERHDSSGRITSDETGKPLDRQWLIDDAHVNGPSHHCFLSSMMRAVPLAFASSSPRSSLSVASVNTTDLAR